MKYELTNETINFFGRKLFRIKALKDIGNNVKKGDLGGFVESESNLSQEGDCWIYGEAKAYDSAKIFGDAEVFGSAKVFGKATVFNSARICDSARVHNSAEVFGTVRVFGSVVIGGLAKVYGSAAVYGVAKVYGTAKVHGSAKIYDSAKVCDEAEVTKTTDVFTITPIGSRNDTTTFYKAKGNKIFVKCGCKNTDIDTWLDMVKETHGDNNYAKAYRLAAQIARLQILREEE